MYRLSSCGQRPPCLRDDAGSPSARARRGSTSGGGCTGGLHHTGTELEEDISDGGCLSLRMITARRHVPSPRLDYTTLLHNDLHIDRGKSLASEMILQSQNLGPAPLREVKREPWRRTFEGLPIFEDVEAPPHSGLAGLGRLCELQRHACRASQQPTIGTPVAHQGRWMTS